MNFPVQPVYENDQSYPVFNTNSIEYLQPPLQLLNNEEKNYPTNKNHLMNNNFPPISQLNDSSFIRIFDPNCQSYLPQMAQTSIYPIPNINPISNANSTMNLQYNYSTNESVLEGYYIGLQNPCYMNNPDYYRAMINLNHMRPFLPQMNYHSNQIAVLNNVQVNSVDTTNYISNSYSNVSSNNTESLKIPTNEKPSISFQEKSLAYKTQENYKRAPKSTWNKSKSIALKSSNSIGFSETGNRNKSSATNNPSPSMPICADESTPDASIVSNCQFIDLLVTNLDYNISAKEWKKLLLNQFQNAIKRVHSVLIQTQPDGSNCGIVRVTTMEDARLAISQFHRRKIGYKRIQVNLVNQSGTSSQPINMKQEVTTLLKSVAGYSLSVYKFIELYEKKYHRNICVSDFYRMRDFVEIKDIGGNQNWKIISLTNTAINSDPRPSDEGEPGENTDTIVCPQHCKEDSADYVTTLEAPMLPNVEIRLKIFKEHVYKILESHNGSVQLLSFLCCYLSEFKDMKVMKLNMLVSTTSDRSDHDAAGTTHSSNDNTSSGNKSSEIVQQNKECINSEGVPLEHLLNCVSGIKITTSSDGIRKIIWDDKKEGSFKFNQGQFSGSASNYSPSLNGLGGILVDRLHQFSREVVDLMKHQPNCRMLLSKFIPTYHHHFGKQCRVADYGFSKLHELIEALPQIVHVIGTGYLRILYLSHKVQVRRFTNEMMKVLKSKTAKTCRLSEYTSTYKLLFHKEFHITDFGVCFIEDLLDDIPDSTVEIVANENDICISIPKRIQTSEEKELTMQFAIEVVDLLKQSPRCRLLFNKFIPSYHHHFSRQCKVAEYGFTKLIELLDAVPHVIQIIEEHGEKYVVLTSYEMLCALAEHSLNILEKSFNKRVPISEFPNLYFKIQGYMLNLEDYSVNSLQLLMEKIPKIAKLQNYSSISPNSTTKGFNSSSESIGHVSQSDTDDKDSGIEQSEVYICLADRNHIKYMAHKVLLILLENPSGSLPDYQFLEKYRYKYREEPNLLLIQNEMYDVLQIVNDSSLLPYPGSSGFHIRLKSLILFARDLKDLMRFNQCKMPLIQLESLYEQHFGFPLKSQNYGYPSIFSLLQACDFVVTLKGRGVRAILVLMSDFVGKLAYRIAYNTKSPNHMGENGGDDPDMQVLNQISMNIMPNDDNDVYLQNSILARNNLTSAIHSNKHACTNPTLFNHQLYAQNNFISPINSYHYFNPQPVYNPWFRQWYQPHAPYGFNPNIYSQHEYGLISMTQSPIPPVAGSPHCPPCPAASQDQQQIDELVETLAYDNSCSSNLTPPPAATFQQIQHGIDANNSIIANPWILYPSHQLVPSLPMPPTFMTTLSNGDGDEIEQQQQHPVVLPPSLINKNPRHPEETHCTNNNNKCGILDKYPPKCIFLGKTLFFSRNSFDPKPPCLSKSIT